MKDYPQIDSDLDGPVMKPFLAVPSRPKHHMCDLPDPADHLDEIWYCPECDSYNMARRDTELRLPIWEKRAKISYKRIKRKREKQMQKESKKVPRYIDDKPEHNPNQYNLDYVTNKHYIHPTDIANELRYAYETDADPWDDTLYIRAAREIESLWEFVKSEVHQAHIYNKSANEIVDWIVEHFGYPIDMTTSVPIPEAWRDRIMDQWAKGYEDDAQMYEDIRRSVAEEGGWVYTEDMRTEAEEDKTELEETVDQLLAIVESEGWDGNTRSMTAIMAEWTSLWSTIVKLERLREGKNNG